MHGDSLLMLTTKVVSNKKPPLLSDSESGGSTSLKFLADYGQLLEECTEILAYCSLVCFTYDISFKKK